MKSPEEMLEINKKISSKPWELREVKTQIGRCFKIASGDFVDGGHGVICLYDDDTSLNPLTHEEIEARAEFIVASHDFVPRAAERLIEAEELLKEYYKRRGKICGECIESGTECDNCKLTKLNLKTKEFLGK